MDYYKITNRKEQNTKRKIQTDDKINGLQNSGNRVQGTNRTRNEKLTLNEHERITHIYRTKCK